MRMIALIAIWWRTESHQISFIINTWASDFPFHFGILRLGFSYKRLHTLHYLFDARSTVCFDWTDETKTKLIWDFGFIQEIRY